MGKCLCQIIRDGGGKVLALYPLMPDRMEVNRTEHGEIFYVYRKDGLDYVLRNDEVFHIPGLGFDGLIGYSSIAMAGDEMLISPVAMMMIHNPSTIIFGESDVTYEKTEKLERAKSTKLSSKSNTENIYSDDTVEDVIAAFEGIDVEIELNQLSIASRAKLQGSKVEKGMLIENKSDIAPTIAYGSYRFIADEDEQDIDGDITKGWFKDVLIKSMIS